MATVAFLKGINGGGHRRVTETSLAERVRELDTGAAVDGQHLAVHVRRQVADEEQQCGGDVPRFGDAPKRGVLGVPFAAFLADHRCDEIQGFLFSPAVPIDQLLPMIAAGRTFGGEWSLPGEIPS